MLNLKLVTEKELIHKYIEILKRCYKINDSKNTGKDKNFPFHDEVILPAPKEVIRKILETHLEIAQKENLEDQIKGLKQGIYLLDCFIPKKDILKLQNADSDNKREAVSTLLAKWWISGMTFAEMEELGLAK